MLRTRTLTPISTMYIFSDYSYDHNEPEIFVGGGSFSKAVLTYSLSGIGAINVEQVVLKTGFVVSGASNNTTVRASDDTAGDPTSLYEASGTIYGTDTTFGTAAYAQCVLFNSSGKTDLSDALSGGLNFFSIRVETDAAYSMTGSPALIIYSDETVEDSSSFSTAWAGYVTTTSDTKTQNSTVLCANSFSRGTIIQRGLFEWDISGIPSDIQSIDEITFDFDRSAATVNSIIVQKLTTRPSTALATALETDTNTPVSMATIESPDTDTFLTRVTLDSTARTDLLNAVQSGQGYWAFAVRYASELSNSSTDFTNYVLWASWTEAEPEPDPDPTASDLYAGLYVSIAQKFTLAMRKVTGVATHYYQAAEVAVQLNDFDPEIDLLSPFYSAYDAWIVRQVPPAVLSIAVKELSNHILRKARKSDGTRYPTINAWLQGTSGRLDDIYQGAIKVSPEWASLSSDGGNTISSGNIQNDDVWFIG